MVLMNPDVRDAMNGGPVERRGPSLLTVGVVFMAAAIRLQLYPVAGPSPSEGFMVVVGFPVIACLGAYVLTRSTPNWTRFTTRIA